MFDKLKSMGALAGLLKDQDKIKAAVDRVKAVSETVRASGEGGGGAVRVVVNGQMRMLEVVFSPALAAGMAADERTRELAGGLVCEAADKAMAAARERMAEVIRRETQDLGLPADMAGLQNLLG